MSAAEDRPDSLMHNVASKDERWVMECSIKVSKVEILGNERTERGVEWQGGLPTETMVEADGLDLFYVALPDGRVRAFIRNYLTPEQAVEATLGRGECSNKAIRPQTFWCDQCDCAAEGWVDVGGTLINGFRYCPNCGRKVVDA